MGGMAELAIILRHGNRTPFVIHMPDEAQDESIRYSGDRYQETRPRRPMSEISAHPILQLTEYVKQSASTKLYMLCVVP